MKTGYSRKAGDISDPYDRVVHDRLVDGNGLFFPNAPAEFRKKFRTRWANQLRNHGWRLRTFIGRYASKDGSFYWVEKING